MPLWKEIKTIRVKSKVMLLADLLIEIGEKYQAHPVINYAEKLQLVCKSFKYHKRKRNW